jgi:flagella basal body P-ring formation protein FlgA
MMPLLASGGELELTLYRNVMARHPYVTVGEIAGTSGTGAEADEVKRVRISLHARPGETVRVSRRRVGEAIAAAVRRVRIQWDGPAYAEVQLASQTVSTAMVVDAAVGYLASVAERERMRVTMSVAGEPAPIEVPAGEVTLVPRRAVTAWRPRTRVEVDVWVDGTRYSSVPVWVHLRMPGVALVAARGLGAGQLLSPEDVRIAEVDLLGVNGKPVTDPERLSRMRTRRGIAEGEIVCEADVERRPVIVRGEAVRVAVNAAAITLEVTGRAAEDGRLGERIRVERESDASAWFYGVVTGEGTVSVYE